MIRSTVNAAENENFYCVTFGDGHGFSIAVQRSLSAFSELLDSLLSVNYLPPDIIPLFSIEPIPDVSQLENFLNYWLRFYNESAQVSDILINFIEDAPGQVEVTQIQFNVLRQKVNALLVK